MRLLNNYFVNDLLLCTYKRMYIVIAKKRIFISILNILKIYCLYLQVFHDYSGTMKTNLIDEVT